MATMTLVTSITEDYAHQGSWFLESMKLVSRARKVCICYMFDAGPELRAAYPHVEFRHMGEHWSACHFMFQHGRALSVLPWVGPDDLMIQSDADVVIQRDFTDEEYDRLEAYDRNTFGLANNQGDDDSLYWELGRIGMRPDPNHPEGDYHKEHWLDFCGGYAMSGENLKKAPVYNCGLIAGRGAAWDRFRDNFESDCLHFYRLSEHRSKIQFWNCWVLHRMGVTIDRLPGEVHSHGHFGLPPDCERRPEPIVFGTHAILNDTLYYKGKKVMFRHRLF